MKGYTVPVETKSGSTSVTSIRTVVTSAASGTDFVRIPLPVPLPLPVPGGSYLEEKKRPEASPPTDGLGRTRRPPSH